MRFRGEVGLSNAESKARQSRATEKIEGDDSKGK